MSVSDAFAVHTPRERQAEIARWRRRSRLIRTLRIVLPALMALITAALIGVVAWRSATQQPPAAREARTPIRLVNARFVGRVEDGRGFMLGARSALRDEGDYYKVSLEEPILVIGDETGSPARVMARSGVYNERDRLLRLTGDVRIDDGAGHRVASESSTIDTRTGKVVGDAGILGDGPLGLVTAKSYSVDEKGDRMILRGGVRARIGGQ